MTVTRGDSANPAISTRHLARRRSWAGSEPNRTPTKREMGSIMKMRGLPIALILLSVLLITATPATARPTREVPPPHAQDCVHPHPCGGEWPTDLEGATFDLLPIEHIRIPSSTYAVDGVELDGWIVRPNVPEGVTVPVLLHSSPYLGDCRFDNVVGTTCRSTPDDPAMMSDDFVGPGAAVYHWGTPALRLAKAGYALVMVSTRGTGRSGGCFSGLSQESQDDQATLVGWAGSQPWSNGRVAMGGISAPAATAWEAATNPQTPSALKTIVTAGIVSDPYTLLRSPQGAPETYGSATFGLYGFNSLVPPLGGAQHSWAADGAIEDVVTSRPERLCADQLVEKATPITAVVSPDRSESYWAERRLIDRFDQVSAAVLLAQGFNDDGHDWQDDIVWEALTSAPKRRLVGQWAHDFPYGTDYGNPSLRVTLDPEWENNQWGSLVTAWLDYWLKGIGSPERLGIVDYQDNQGAWHDSTAWPPKEAKEEVLYLAGDNLAPEPDGSSRSFLSAPDITNSHVGANQVDFPYAPYSALCQDPVHGTLPTGLAYLTPKLDEDLLLAGNVFAYLRLTSDQPGGLITAKLIDIGPNEQLCDEFGQPRDVRQIERAAADLRFHAGNFVAEDFRTDGQPTSVRLDFADLAYKVLKDHRLGLILSYGETHSDFVGAPFPQIGVLGDGGALASHLVLPLVEDSFGGMKPKLDYPVRPFTPAS